MCRSMGRDPRAQPPGQQASARPDRASRDPRKRTEARICPIRRSGTAQPCRQVVSTRTVRPSRVTRQPRLVRISSAPAVSVRSGQLCMTLSPSASKAAARMGRALFFAP